MPETVDSSHWSARCYNLLSEDQGRELGASATLSKEPGCHESEACGQMANNSDIIPPPLPANTDQNFNAENNSNGGG